MDEQNDPRMETIENASTDDVLPGDHITWERTKVLGGVVSTERREGIAHRRDGDGDWLTKDRAWITDAARTGFTLTIRRPVPALPTEDGAFIVPADGCQYITATVGDQTYRAREAMLSNGRWYAIWRTPAGRRVHYSLQREYITPDTWKVDDQ